MDKILSQRQIDFSSNPKRNKESGIIWVADYFFPGYSGGAEMTDDALIHASPFKVQKIYAENLSWDDLKKYQDHLWVFGNFTRLHFRLLKAIGRLKYVVIEYDYKFCGFRSPTMHRERMKHPCLCHFFPHGKSIGNFFQKAQLIFWMARRQWETYRLKFDFLSKEKNIVLSSVFHSDTLDKIAQLREKNKDFSDKKWIVAGTSARLKGFAQSKRYCLNNKLPYRVIWNLPYEKFLEEISKSQGLVYLPIAEDTCPRMVIETKLLGRQLIINNFIQHKDEEWFNASVSEIEMYLKTRADCFWNNIRRLIKVE